MLTCQRLPRGASPVRRHRGAAENKLIVFRGRETKSKNDVWDATAAGISNSTSKAGFNPRAPPGTRLKSSRDGKRSHIGFNPRVITVFAAIRHTSSWTSRATSHLGYSYSPGLFTSPA